MPRRVVVKSQPQPQSLSSIHVRSLDGLRGVAVLLVLLHSLNVLDLGSSGTAAAVLEHLLDIGWIGVQLFFVLSGYLITGILIELANRRTT